jgi:hypothetical protein
MPIGPFPSLIGHILSDEENSFITLIPNVNVVKLFSLSLTNGPTIAPTKKKCFKTLTMGINVMKPFFFLALNWTK